jgi:hypothetical protein
MDAPASPVPLVFAAALAACSSPSRPPPPPPPPTPPPQPTQPRIVSQPTWDGCGAPVSPQPPASVRDVAWCDRTIDVGSGQTIDLDRGIHESRVYVCDLVPGHEGEHTTLVGRLVAVAYGDVDGDGVEDAALLVELDRYECDPAWNAHVSRIAVYAVRDGGVVGLGGIGVDRLDGASLAVEAGAVTLRSTGGAAVRWRWDGAARSWARDR